MRVGPAARGGGVARPRARVWGSCDGPAVPSPWGGVPLSGGWALGLWGLGGCHRRDRPIRQRGPRLSGGATSVLTGWSMGAPFCRVAACGGLYGGLLFAASPPVVASTVVTTFLMFFLPSFCALPSPTLPLLPSRPAPLGGCPDHVDVQDAWRQRKRIVTEAVSLMAEGAGKKPAEMYEKIGIETDEEAVRCLEEGRQDSGGWGWGGGGVRQPLLSLRPGVPVRGNCGRVGGRMVGWGGVAAAVGADGRLPPG